MVQKVITSRLFVLAVVFCLMSSALVMRLFNLQIIQGRRVSGCIYSDDGKSHKDCQHAG